MPAPDFKQELRHLKFPIDANTRPTAVLSCYDPVTDMVLPITAVGVTGIGACLNTNIIGGVMQVESIHVSLDEYLPTVATGINNNANPPERINPSTEETLQDILEALGGGSSVNKFSLFDSETVAPGNTPTILLDYTVPPGLKFRIESIRGWADVDAEFGVYLDTLQVDGYRTTPANLTMNIEGPAIQHATAGQHIIVSALHYKKTGSRLMKATVQGQLETI